MRKINRRIEGADTRACVYIVLAIGGALLALIGVGFLITSGSYIGTIALLGGVLFMIEGVVYRQYLIKKKYLI